MKTTITLILVMGIISLGSAQSTQDKSTFNHSFTHAVYFWLKNPQDQSDRDAFEKSLKTLLDKSKYAKTNFIGTPPKAVRNVVDDSFTYALFLTFESAKAQEAYQTEEVHLAFIEESNHLWEKVMVYDAIGLEE